MSRAPAPAALAAALALTFAAAPAPACRDAAAPIGWTAGTAFLLGAYQGTTVDVPPGDIDYYDRGSLVPESNDVPVRGYVVRVQAFHGAGSDALGAALARADSRAILVPWGYRGDCKTARWNESAGRWLTSRETAVFAARPRGAAGPDGVPVLDVLEAYFEPYPSARMLRNHLGEKIRTGQAFLTVQEFFIFAAALPALDEETGKPASAEAAVRWAAENPELAARWPASESLELLRAAGAL